MQPFRLVALAGANSLPVTSHSHTRELPALPETTITVTNGTNTPPGLGRTPFNVCIHHRHDRLESANRRSHPALR